MSDRWEQVWCLGEKRKYRTGGMCRWELCSQDGIKCGEQVRRRSDGHNYQEEVA